MPRVPGMLRLALLVSAGVQLGRTWSFTLAAPGARGGEAARSRPRFRARPAATMEEDDFFEEDVEPYEDLNEAQEDVSALSARIAVAEQSAAEIARSKQLFARTEMIDGIFRALDVSRTGRLGSREMRRFADLSGFDGDDADWEQEFPLLCKDVSSSESKGIDRATFMRMVDDESEEGCHCSCEEVQYLYAQLV
eukprot:CAMPEP_0171159466 /NCGR_PEP_ID=MMETSP0790-20130122/3053_1 /TAXON_ID=2925 /ORGANISM="Alexandrium catenella, Strain OF101" /LENGTH=193 /DNA_ID=CAMNT_0011623963 /DNA_START=1 /DNA_END=579 /DNA_ORIENTATION=-